MEVFFLVLQDPPVHPEEEKEQVGEEEGTR
jgi:hypothetical protein